MDAAEFIRAEAARLGFCAVGFSTADLPAAAAQGLRDFLDSGHHGTMEWLGTRAEQRGSPRALWPAVRSVVALGFSYAPAGDALENLSRPDVGNISVYARGRDYHDVIKGRLKELVSRLLARFPSEAKVFVDTAPVMEKPIAQQAGIGWQGKHTNLVSRTHGSWLFLAEIFSTLDLPADEPHVDRCGTCRACLDVCPTNAFPAPYKLDARRCISYLTIEHDGPIPRELRPLIGNRIYGCDDCLAVCPWNSFSVAGREAKLSARADLVAPPLAELATLDDAAFRARFAGGPIKRIGRNRFVRNVATAIGNSADASLGPAAQTLAADVDPMVAEAGQWAAARLSP